MFHRCNPCRAICDPSSRPHLLCWPPQSHFQAHLQPNWCSPGLSYPTTSTNLWPNRNTVLDCWEEQRWKHSQVLPWLTNSPKYIIICFFYLSAAVLTLCYPWACVIAVLVDRMSQRELVCFWLVVNVNSSDINVFIPLCVLYSPTQKDVWLSLNSSKLLTMNFCSSGSSMLARVPPLGHNSNNDKCNWMIRTPDIKCVQNCLSLTKSNTATNGICPFNQICNK